MRQPTFFDPEPQAQQGANAERVALYALGEFQARGHELIGRDLPLDRLRGALRRAAERFGIGELSDESAASALGALGAQVRRVPSFFAKHPFRVNVAAPLAQRAREFFREESEQNL